MQVSNLHGLCCASWKLAPRPLPIHAWSFSGRPLGELTITCSWPIKLLAQPRLGNLHRARAGLVHGTCHELRHTCLTRLREAGMSLEALQAQAGHRSIVSTRVYLHLGSDWLADEYRRAAEVIDAQAAVGLAR